jgi:hypothetical protein
VTRAVNAAFDALWRVSGGRVGVVASWLGVYRMRDPQVLAGAGNLVSPGRASEVPG